MVRILFLSANPDHSRKLNVGQEFNGIYARIRCSEYRDQFELQQRNAVSLSELQDHILDTRPNIVHFSGHGTAKGMLIFENAYGRAQKASPKALSDLFGIVNGDDTISHEEKIRLVVLSACYAEKQAKAIAKYVNSVIGISDEIKDRSARS